MTVAYDEQTEAGLIGAVVTWPDRVLDAVLAANLEPEHFYVPRYARAWQAVLDVVAADQPVDANTVAARCDRETIADAICASAETIPFNAPVWAVVIRNYARARSVLGPIDAMRCAAEAGDLEAVVDLVHDVIDTAAPATA